MVSHHSTQDGDHEMENAFQIHFNYFVRGHNVTTAIDPSVKSNQKKFNGLSLSKASVGDCIEHVKVDPSILIDVNRKNQALANVGRDTLGYLRAARFRDVDHLKAKQNILLKIEAAEFSSSYFTSGSIEGLTSSVSKLLSLRA